MQCGGLLSVILTLRLTIASPLMPYSMIFLSPRELTSRLHPSDDLQDVLSDVSLTLNHTHGVALIMKDAIHWPSTTYLAEIAFFGHSATGDTVRTYAESLLKYLNYLDQRGIELVDSSEFVLQSYRNSLSTVTLRDKSLSTRTINLNVSTARRFLAWGAGNGQFSSPLGIALCQKNYTSQHVGQRNLPRPSLSTFKAIRNVEKRIPRVLSVQEVKALFTSCGKPFSLMFKWAVITGVRRFELCNLQVAELPSRSDVPSRGLREMKITRKGGKTSTVYAPEALIDETWWYIVSERALPRDGNGHVFIGQRGRKVGRNYFSEKFKKHCAAISPHATLHHLRHTFAVLTLMLLQRRAAQGDPINPLKTLQVLMGHASIASTEIYLRAIDIHSEAVEETLNFLYGENF